MQDLAFILTPLLVLPVVALFRFVGCGHLDAAPDTPSPPPGPPRYRDYIMGVPDNPGPVPNPEVKPNASDIAGYWRLIDPAGFTFAHDETGFQDGEYHTLPSGPGESGFFTGETSLIASDAKAMCRIFDGGFVSVPYEFGLYADEFSIEAWIDAQWDKNSTGTEHVLFFAGGHYAAPTQVIADFHGFGLYADTDNRWQAFLSPHPGGLFPAPPLVPFGGRTHVALTVGRDTPSSPDLTATLYLDAKPAATANIGFYSRPDGAPLLIGVGNRNSDPANPPDTDRPMTARIQEVVLYKKALSRKEIENHVGINHP